MEEYAVSYSRDDFEPLLIYRNSFDNSKKYFDDYRDMAVDDDGNQNLLKLPPYYDYFGEDEDSIHNHKGEVKRTAEEILDIVKEKHYPNMKRADYTADKEMLDNYAVLLGYAAPKYYYTDGVHNLYYNNVEYDKNAGRWKHEIICGGDMDMEFYKVWDDTGDIIED